MIKDMIKELKDLPVENSFADALAKAAKKGGYYACVINGIVYSFYKNTHNYQDFVRMSPGEYDYWCGVSDIVSKTDCDLKLK